MKLSKIAIRNLQRNKKRSVLSITATAIATFTMVALLSFIAGMTKDMEDINVNYLTGQIEIRHIDYDEKSFSLDRAIDNYSELLGLLKKNYPTLEFSPRIKFPSTVFDKVDYDKSYSSFGVAVDFESEESYLGLSDKIVEGAIPTDSRGVILGIGLAEELKLDIGDKFTAITSTRRGASSGITFTVSALAKFSDSGFTNKTFIVSLDELPTMLKMEGAVSDLLIKGFGDQDLGIAAKELKSFLDKNGYTNLDTVSWKETSAYEYIGMAESIYGIMGFVFFALASTVIANTMLMVVFERRKEIGTITAMGMSSKEVVRLFFIEAFYLGVIGAFIGVLAGIALVLPLSNVGIDMSTMAGEVDFNSSFNIFPQLSLKSTLGIFLYSVFVASIISFFPSRGAAKVDPIVALRG